MAGTRILIVDDEEDMRALVRATIEIANKGLEVSGEAADGEAAIAQWRADRPEVIVLDQRMPGATGLETAQQILAEHPEQAIVLFTAFLDDAIRRSARRLGISVLAKQDIQRLPQALWDLEAS
jgi:DNA-binding NarL/FixJ family response regulator